MSADFAKPVDTTFVNVTVNDDALADMIQSTETYVYWAPWPKVIKKEILLKFPFTVGRIYEDSAVVFRWLCEAGTVAECDAKLYFYQVNDSGTTKKAFSLKRLDKLWSFEEQMAYYAAHDYSKSLDITFHSYMFTICGLVDKVQTELGRKDVARQLRQKGVQALKSYRSRVTISQYEKDRWMVVLKPLSTKIKWKLRQLLNKKG